MTALDNIRLGSSSIRTVSDLGSTESHRLVRAVEEALLEIPDAMLRPMSKQGTRLVFQPRMLLGLLVFWYARQVYDSGTILAELRRDIDRCGFPQEDIPDAEVLRRFRSENRAVLHSCLTAVLHALAEAKMEQGIVTHLSDRQLAEEASRRIIMAMFADSIELEKSAPAEGAQMQYFPIAKG